MENAAHTLTAKGFREVERKVFGSFGNWFANYAKDCVQVRMGYERRAYIEVGDPIWNDWFGAHTWVECLTGEKIAPETTWPFSEQVHRLIGMLDEIEVAIDRRGDTLFDCLSATRRAHNLAYLRNFPQASAYGE